MGGSWEEGAPPCSSLLLGLGSCCPLAPLSLSLRPLLSPTPNLSLVHHPLCQGKELPVRSALSKSTPGALSQ